MEEVDILRKVVGADMILWEEGVVPRKGFGLEGIGLGVGFHSRLQGVDIDLEGDTQIDCTVVAVVEDIPGDREGGIVGNREQAKGCHKADILAVEVPRMIPEVAPEEEDILPEDLGNTTLE